MRKNFDLPAIREKLAGSSGKKYWRSLEEIAETEAFKDFLNHEFPQGADQWLNPMGRRNFLKLMAASLALGGLVACNPSQNDKILPYVRAPEEIVPGQSLFFATAVQLRGVATGVLAESHMGRPTKIEGNPDHPGSLGATNTLMQASVLDVWDPNRSQSVLQAGLTSSWTAFVDALAIALEAQRIKNGAGLRLLTETITSPTLGRQLETLLQEFPQAKWHQYEPINRDNARQGALLAFGRDVNPICRFDRARVVLSLDADFMGINPGTDVRYNHDFSELRRVRSDKTDMNRLYVVENSLSTTGSMADHHLALKSGHIQIFVRALAAELGLEVEAPTALPHLPDNFLPALARDLQANAGASVVLAGRNQSPDVHALVHALNESLGNVGQTVLYTDPLETNPIHQGESLQELVDEMAAGQVDMLVILEANPVYNAPGNLNFLEHFKNVPLRIRHGLYDDETSAWCHWHVPAKHYLESWLDARAYDGTISLAQPLIEPLYDDVSQYELLSAMLGRPGLSDYDLIREYWATQGPVSDFEIYWKQSVYNGFMPDTALPPLDVAVNMAEITAVGGVEPAEGLEVVFAPDPSLWDGRFANNGWLQELPKPITKLTWDNPVMVSPATAERLGLSSEDVVELSVSGRSLDLPVWVKPGQADDCLTVHLGFGRRRVGRVGNAVGVNTYTVRPSDAPWIGTGADLRKTGEQYPLASTQMHYNMEGRNIVRAGTIERYREEPNFVENLDPHIDTNMSLLPGFEYTGYAWGMVVDLNVCNGCNACVTACQSENNIPVVGKEQVQVGREMHWIRLDTYFEGELDHPQAFQQPMLCQHCEQAPCELVCPVNATVHDHEGLNVMVYNRCIGTRYCSNNCPYKVRRFNFLQYNDETDEALKGHRNPNVSVRTRGVMEKCTFCVQRISQARINAKNEDRPIADGEVVTACQAACPTNAIVFGNINDPDSAVSKAKAQPQNYGVLTELGTRPRTSYLAKLRNPNPELEDPNPLVEEQH